MAAGLAGGDFVGLGGADEVTIDAVDWPESCRARAPARTFLEKEFPS